MKINENKFVSYIYFILYLHYQIKTINIMATTNEYATITFNGSNTYMVIDSANQCRFATSSERKAKNFLAKLLKQASN